MRIPWIGLVMALALTTSAILSMVHADVLPQVFGIFHGISASGENSR